MELELALALELELEHDQRTRKRLAWRCRRGTKELDVILSGFLDNHYGALSATGQQLFERLLESADPQLTDWLCNGTTPADQGMATIVKQILSAPRA